MQNDNIGEHEADRDTNNPAQVDIEQIQTGDPGRMMHSDMQRLSTEEDPTKTPLTKDDDEEVVDENYKQDMDNQ